MADLRIADSPEIALHQIQDGQKHILVDSSMSIFIGWVG